MSYSSPLPASGIRSSAFGACAAAVLGFALLEAACVLLNARLAVHLGAILAGGSLVTVTWRRFLRHWPAQRPAQRALPATAAPQRIVPALLVAGAAYCAAGALAHGLVSPFILFALALVLLPWARFADTRAGCLGLAGAAAAGIAAGLVGLRFNPMLLLASAWTLWLSAILGWARVAFAEKMAGRRVPAW